MTVLITLTTAGTDTGPFNLYSDTDGYVSAFETGVSKAALVAGYSSSLVPNGTTIIRVKSTGVCTNYIDIPLSTTTTSTSSTTTTSSSTTTTTTTVFSCADCRNWEYNGATIPAEGDTIFYYRCSDGASQSIVLSNGDPTGNFCNCNTIGNPSTLNGTTLTEIGICVSTTTTTTAPPPTTTTTTTVIECVQYVLDSNGSPASIEWFDCGGSPLTQTFNGQYTICTDGSGYTVTGGSVSVVSSGSCAS